MPFIGLGLDETLVLVSKRSKIGPKSLSVSVENQNFINISRISILFLAISLIDARAVLLGLEVMSVDKSGSLRHISLVNPGLINL